MELSERMQVERYELGRASEDGALRARSGVAVAALSVVTTALAALLAVAAATVFEGWPHLVVIGGIVATTVGLMIAISPNRHG